MSATELTTILENVSVIIASVVAIFGIDAWRREHVGRRHMELAEEVLALFYQARDAIQHIRSPFGFSGEGESRKTYDTETPEVKEARDKAYVLIERYQKHTEIFSRLQSLRYRFMAQLGTEASRPFDDLNSVINELLLSARQLGRYWTFDGHYHGCDPQQEEMHYARIKKAEAIFWQCGDDDPIQPKIDSLVISMEATCKGILTSKGTLFGLINLPVYWRKHR